MNNKSLIAIGVVVIVAIAAFMVMRTSPQNPLAEENAPYGKMSMKALLAVEDPQTCVFTSSNDISQSSGTVYVANGRLRGDFESVAAGVRERSHMIVDGNTSYTWTESQPTGMMMMLAEWDAQGASHGGAADLNQEQTYSCAPWSPDESAFQRPGNVNFMSMEAMMQGGAMMGDDAMQMDDGMMR